jgi:hypothetical protein
MSFLPWERRRLAGEVAAIRFEAVTSSVRPKVTRPARRRRCQE